MSNMNQVGHGVPIMELADANKVILYYKGVPVHKRFSALTYEYQETGKDDKCSIVLEFPREDQGIIDMVNLQHDQKIHVRWGYLGEGFGPWRLVAIRDYETQYNQGMTIRHTLRCTDLPSYLKASRMTIDQIIKLPDWIEQISKGRFVPVTPLLHYLQDSGRRSAYEYRSEYNAVTSTARDNTAIPVTFMDKYTVVVSAGQTDWAHVEDILEAQDGENSIINGRDDRLEVKPTADWGAPVIGVYRIFKDDNIIHFNPKTNHKDNSKDEDELTTVDPETGEVITVNRDTVRFDSDVSEADVEEVIQGGAVETQGTSAEEDYDDEVNVPQHYSSNDLAKQGEGIRKEFRKFALEMYEHNMSAAPDAQRYMPEFYQAQGKEFYGAQPIPTRILINDPAFIDDAKALSVNEMGKREEQKKTATMKLVGDARIESGKIIIITNAAMMHSGRHYLTKVVHEWSTNGATTSVTGIREVTTKDVLRTLIKNVGDEPKIDDGEFINALTPWLSSQSTRDRNIYGVRPMYNLGSNYDIPTETAVKRYPEYVVPTQEDEEEDLNFTAVEDAEDT